MTLQEFVAQYTGQTIGTGQCGELVYQYALQVQGVTLPSYQDAKDYWFNPVPGYVHVSSNPIAGDVAVYNAHGIYTEGHITVYVGNGEVFEQNADPDGSPAHIFARANTYLLGYLRKGDTMLDQTGVVQIFQIGYGRSPSQDEINQFVGKEYHELLTVIQANNSVQQNAIANFANVEAELATCKASQSDIINVTVNGTEYVPKG